MNWASVALAQEIRHAPWIERADDNLRVQRVIDDFVQIKLFVAG
jgi:hypothetical protein